MWNLDAFLFFFSPLLSTLLPPQGLQKLGFLPFFLGSTQQNSYFAEVHLFLALGLMIPFPSLGD